MSPRRDTPDRGDDPIVVPQALDGERVDRAVALLTGWSRAEVQALLRDGEIIVGGEDVGKSRRLARGRRRRGPRRAGCRDGAGRPSRADRRALRRRTRSSSSPSRPGSSSIPARVTSTARSSTVCSLGTRSSPVSESARGRASCIDSTATRAGCSSSRGTARAYEHLVAALARRDVERDYLALVWGDRAAPRGVVDAPIGRSAPRRTRMAVRDVGQSGAHDVRGRLRVARRRCHAPGVRPRDGPHAPDPGPPLGGRAPVVGDVVYGSRRQVASVELDRPFLHATRLAFPHPRRLGTPVLRGAAASRAAQAVLRALARTRSARRAG